MTTHPSRAVRIAPIHDRRASLDHWANHSRKEAILVRLCSMVLRKRLRRSGTISLTSPLARVSIDSRRRVAAPPWSGASSTRWRNRKGPNCTSLAVHAWQLASRTVNDVLPSLRSLWVGLLVNLLDDGTADRPTSVGSAGPSKGVRVGCPACLAHLIRQQSWRSTAFAHVRLDRRRD